jgi:hypothetical protein
MRELLELVASFCAACEEGDHHMCWDRTRCECRTCKGEGDGMSETILKLSGAGRKSLTRLLRRVLRDCQADRNGFTVVAKGHPEHGRMMEGDKDITEITERDEKDARVFLRMLKVRP